MISDRIETKSTENIIPKYNKIKMGENKMKLEKLLERMDYKVLAGSTDIEISTLVYDSRKVEKASVFVCISGAVSAVSYTHLTLPTTAGV